MAKNDTEWIHVTSSNLTAVWHSCAMDLLMIEFKDGSIYAYQKRQHWLFERLIAASSKGRFAHRYIYPYEPLGICVFAPNKVRPATAVELHALLEQSIKELQLS